MKTSSQGPMNGTFYSDPKELGQTTIHNNFLDFILHADTEKDSPYEFN